MCACSSIAVALVAGDAWMATLCLIAASIWPKMTCALKDVGMLVLVYVLTIVCLIAASIWPKMTCAIKYRFCSCGFVYV